MKRAPAPTWPALRSLLSGLEVGASGELRLPMEPPLPADAPHPQKIVPHDLSGIEGADGEPLSGFGFVGYESDEVWLSPLRPGRYWVPEEWEVVQSGTDRHSAQPDRHWADLWYRDGDRRRVWRDKPVSSRTWYARLSAHNMPKWAARLACSVGEERVEGWCESCEGEGEAATCPECGWQGPTEDSVWVALAEDDWWAESDGKEEDAELGCPTCCFPLSWRPCPACGGTPPPAWVYPVKRTEVER